MEDNILGKAIGKVSHSFNITNDAGNKVSLTITVDFSTASDQDIKSWLVSNRVIAGQRPWRALSKAELKAINGRTFMAQNIGQKVKSREEQIQTLVAAGLPRKLAEFSVDNPAAFQAAVDGIEVETPAEDLSSPELDGPYEEEEEIKE
jgi:hypothetical protein